MMTVDRILPSVAAADLMARVREIARGQLGPRAAAAEATSTFPRDAFTTLGEAGLLGLPYPVALGGGGQSYEVYLQALEEIASAWMTVGVGLSVHTMSCHALATWGRPDQLEDLLPPTIGGDQLGGYALSEADAGSDITAMTSQAKVTDEGYSLMGAKSWITHGSHADFYTVFARTSSDRTRGISCFLVPADSPGLTFGAPERKMGLTASTTAAMYLDAVPVSQDRRIGDDGQGMRIALSALDSGRLGIAACATGLAQAALDCAVAHAQTLSRGRRSADDQGIQFLLAEMAAGVDTARATYVMAARKRDAGLPFTRDAAAAKMVATDVAVRVTSNAVQVLAEDGCTDRFPVERYLREAKVTQIFEGTNQIQRLVIARQLLQS